MKAIAIAWNLLGGFFSKLFAFFTTKPGVYILALLIAVAIVWYANHSGYKRGVAERDAQYKEETAKAIESAYRAGLLQQQKLDANLSKIGYDAGLAKGREEAKTIYITKRIPQYVSKETDATFSIPCGLVRVHDAEATGRTPEDTPNPSGLADGDACPVTASHLAEVIVTNYGIAHDDEAQIAGLQNLVKTLADQISNPN